MCNPKSTTGDLIIDVHAVDAQGVNGLLFCSENRMLVGFSCKFLE